MDNARRFIAVARHALVLACALAAGACLPAVAHAEASPAERALATPAISVEVPDHVVLIAVATAGKRLVAVGEHGVVAYSDDNGKTWQQGQVPVDVTLTAVGFANAQDGWAVGHEGVILHTTDGGASWQRQLDGDQVNQLTMATAQAAVADNDPAPGTARAMLRANHFLAGGPENPFLAILATSPQDALVFGAYRMVMKTVDGGKTWADWNLHVSDPISHNLYDVATVGNDIYLVGEAGSVFRSTDGGDGFTAVTAPSGSTLFKALPTGDGGVFVCGVAGSAFRSSDGGNSWQPISLNTQSNLTAADMLSSGAIIVGDEGGLLHVSYDHGKSFSTLPEVQPMEIFGLTQAPDGDIIAVGNTGVIMIPAEDLSQG